MQMKPIKLLLSAIGPYASAQELDFEHFGQNGVVLITGDIGTGKTFLFDAISFALFGEMSGQYRQTKSLRSQYAPETAESYVDLYFTHQGKEYHVYRVPAYTRSKKRGSGTIEVAEEASLYCENELIAAKVTKVNKLIPALLGVNYKQFKQIAMIAQGEFQKLLNASTGDWTEILRSIFLTDGYQQMGVRLKEKQDAALRDWERQKDRVLQSFLSVSADEESDCFEKLADMKEKLEASDNVWNVEELTELVGALLEEDKREEKRLTKEQKQLQEILNRKKEELAVVTLNNAFIDRYESFEKERSELAGQQAAYQRKEQLFKRQQTAVYEIAPALHRAEEKKAQLLQIQDRLTKELEKKETAQKQRMAWEEKLAAAEKNREKAECLKQQAEKIAAELEGYEKRDRLLERQEMLKQQGILLAQEEQTLVQKEQQHKENIEKLEQERKQYENSKSELIRLLAKKEALEQSVCEIQDFLTRQYPAWEGQKQELQRLQLQFESERKVWAVQKEKLEQAERIRENNRAGLLAKKLKEGMRCPVCGSTTHPKIAVLQPEVLTKEEYQKLKEDVTEAEKKKQAALLKAEASCAALGKEEERLRETLQKLLKNAEEGEPWEKEDAPEKALPQLKRKAEDYQEQLELCKKQQVCRQREAKQFEIAGELLEKARGIQAEQLTQNRQALMAGQETYQRTLFETQAQLKQYEALIYPDQKQAKNEQKKRQEEAETLFLQLRMAEQQKKENEEKLAAAAAAAEALADSAKGLKKELSQAEAALKELLEEKKFADPADAQVYFVEQSRLEESAKELESYRQRVLTNEEQWKQAKEDAQGRVRKDGEKLKETVAQQTACLDALSKELSRREHRILENDARRRQLLQMKAGLEQLQEQSARYTRLYRLVSGNIGSAAKISLEQYVQAEGFEEMIAAANQRLEYMSMGRYVLYRRETATDKRRSTVLDLDVLDHYTGYKRPVSSLSGGESFMASLCLALGMSDMVSSRLGGIQMEALFIDEGFGTLDAATIDCAVGALSTLSGRNKFVGIISHRTELKESIPNQIEVSKSKQGSTIGYRSLFS